MLKTTFKKVALVSAAALGLGVLSAIPSQAAVSSLTISVTNGTDTAGKLALDTSGAATLTVSGITTERADSIVVTMAHVSSPAASAGILVLNNPAPSTLSVLASDTVTVTATGTAAQGNNGSAYNNGGAITGRTDSVSAYSSTGATSAQQVNISAGTTGANSYTGKIGASFFFYLDTRATNTALIAGTYTYQITATPYTISGAGTPVTQNVSIVVSALSTSGSTSTAFIGSSTSNTFNSETLTVAATSTGSAVAYFTVTLKSSTGSTVGVAESVTATTTVGNVGKSDGTVLGKNVQLQYTAGSALEVGIFGDGTSGNATVCVSTASVSFPCKTVIFYSTTAASITATQVSTTLAIGANSNAIVAKTLDASGNWIPLATRAYIFSDNTAVVSETASSCAVDTTNQRMNCTLTGVGTGTANIVIGSSVTKTLVSSSFKVTVTNSAIASIALTTNKTSYLPGEKAYVRVTAKDAAGNSVAPAVISNFFATGGITTDVGLGSGSDATTSTTVTLGAVTTTGYATGDAVAQFTVYMPMGASSVTFSATGGSGLPVAAQKAVSVKVDVTDSGSQALAAVTALASQVSAFITKINAQITTLTDLVMKIQKKVKA